MQPTRSVSRDRGERTRSKQQSRRQSPPHQRRTEHGRDEVAEDASETHAARRSKRSVTPPEDSASAYPQLVVASSKRTGRRSKSASGYAFGFLTIDSRTVALA